MNLTNATLVVACVLAFGACQSPTAHVPTERVTTAQPDVQVLREGDVVRVAFPASPNLDTTQQVRRDGRITLSMIGELRVAGMAPAELERQLVEKYAPQLLSKEVSVSIV